MSHLKKILVLTLVATMVLGLAGSGFAAAPKVITTAFSDAKGHEAEGALAFLAGLGVYKGDKGIGGPARPDDPITRAEFAAVVVRAMGKEKTAQAMANYVPDFADAAQIPSWAWGYVKVASTLGLVKGYEDGTFRANNQVTQAEALAMLVRAIGHESLVKGVWPGNYVTYGYDVGIAGDLEIFANMPATRGEVAQMVENAMGVVCYNAVAEKYLDEDDDGELEAGANDDAVLDDEIPNKATLRAGALRSGWQLWKGTVTAVDEDDAVITIGDTDIDLDSQVVISGVSKLSALVNYEVEAVGKGDKIMFIGVTKGTDVAAGKFWRMAERSGPKYYIELADGTLVRYDPTDLPKLVINGDEIEITGANADARHTAFKNELNKFTKDKATDAYLEVEIRQVKKDGTLYASYVDATFWSIVDGVLGDPDDAITFRDPDVGEEEDEVVVKGYGYTLSGDPARWNKDSGTADHDFKIDDDTVIKLNGQSAKLSDLEENDVLKVAVPIGADGSPVGPAVKVEVTRKTISGEVTAVSAKDDYYYVKIKKADGKTEEIKVDRRIADPRPATYKAPPDIGSDVVYGLNAAGVAQVAIEEVTPNDILLVTGKYAIEDEDGIKYYLVVDNKGDSATYEVTSSVYYNAADKDSVIQVLNWSGKKIAQLVEIYDPPATRPANEAPAGLACGMVASAGSDSVVVKVWNGTGFDTRLSHDDVAVYAEKTKTTSLGTKEGTGEVGDYIGTGALKKDDKVWVAVSGGGEVLFVLKPYKAPTFNWPF